MRRLSVLLLAIVALFLASCRSQQPPQPLPATRAADAASDRSAYGGCLAIRGTRTGFFHTQKIAGRWMLVDPDGYGFLAIGMTGNNLYSPGRFRASTSPAVDEMRKSLRARYPTTAQWSDAQVSRLKDWGFNALLADTLAGGEKSMPYAIILSVTGGTRDTTFNDVFSQAFEERALRVINSRCQALRDDPNLIGYFTGNELFWGANWYGGMLDSYLALPWNALGHAVAIRFLRERYATVEAFNRAWDVQAQDFAFVGSPGFKPGPSHDRLRVAADRDEFLFRVSERFYGFLAQEIRRVDPNHMIMGSRFLTGDVSLAVARGMRGNVDVVSFNCYALNNWPDQLFSSFSQAADAPILTSEFGYSGKDSGLPMDRAGAIPRIVDTQQDRADKYDWYVSHLVTCPYLVGTTWWWYTDGFGGNNVGNFGFINWKDQPYETLARRATQVNAGLYQRVLAGSEKLATVTPSRFNIARVSSLKLDASPDKYGTFDLHIDYRNRYEGFDFRKSGLAADIAIRHDADYVYVAAKVRDQHVRTYTENQVNADGLKVWELDSVEVWLGYHHALLRLDGNTKAVCTFGEGAIDNVQVAGSLTPDGYFIEAAFPKRDLIDVMRDGDLPFAVGVNDGQAKERFRQIFYPPSYEWAYLETLALGRLR